jgi:hypothetical protein
MKKLSVIVSLSLSLVLLISCAVNSGITDMHNGTYLVTKQAPTGFHGSGNLKAEAINEARIFCESKGLKLKVISATEAQPPYVFGNFPKAEIVFIALSPGDPKLATPIDYTSDEDTIKIKDNLKKVTSAENAKSEERSKSYDALLKLSELREKGLITEQEFEAEKAILLKK